MRTPVYSGKFKKQYRLAEKRGKNIKELDRIIAELAFGRELPRENKDHELKGKYTGFRECHIEPDWLLIYWLVDDELHLIHTGTHADLFD